MVYATQPEPGYAVWRYNVIRIFCLSIVALFLSACSMEGLADKMVPADVLADHNAHIDAMLAGDMSTVKAAFKDDVDLADPAIVQRFAEMKATIPDGPEIRRDYVGVSSSASASLGDGKSRDIALITEVQTEGGFLTVNSQYTLRSSGECCRLISVNVEKFETSPLREGMEMAGRVARTIGLVILCMMVLLVVLLVWRMRVLRRRRQQA